MVAHDAARVAGRCPSCDHESLYLGAGGHVTCAVATCDNPAAADSMLRNPGLAKATFDALVERNQRLDRIERIARGEVDA